LDSKHNLAKDLTRGESLVCLCGVAKRIGSRDWYLELCLLHGTTQMLKLPDAGDCVVGDDFYAATLPRLWFDSIRICEPAAAAEGVQAACERFTTREREHGIDARQA
jgi:hypothetical protein